MRLFQVATLLACILANIPFTTAQAPHPPHSTITLAAADQTSLIADFYPAAADAPVVLLLHMLNSSRQAYAPIIPELHAANYAILNIDMRGHGESAGSRQWDLAISDISGWADWLTHEAHLGERGLALIGGSIGANVALISCAEIEACRGAIALSPGLDYRGVMPEAALVEGLAERGALLVAAQADAYSANSVKQMFMSATGDVSARLYPGRAHGTRLFDTELASVSSLMLNWLAEAFADYDT